MMLVSRAQSRGSLKMRMEEMRRVEGEEGSMGAGSGRARRA